MKSTTEIFEIREGGINHAVHKLPGQSRWENLILKTGLSSDASLMSLREMIINDEYSSGSMNMMQGFQPGGSVSQGVAALSGAVSGVGPSQAQPKRFNGSIVIKNNLIPFLIFNCYIIKSMIIFSILIGWWIFGKIKYVFISFN